MSRSAWTVVADVDVPVGGNTRIASDQIEYGPVQPLSRPPARS